MCDLATIEKRKRVNVKATILHYIICKHVLYYTHYMSVVFWGSGGSELRIRIEQDAG